MGIGRLTPLHSMGRTGEGLFSVLTVSQYDGDTKSNHGYGASMAGGRF